MRPLRWLSLVAVLGTAYGALAQGASPTGALPAGAAPAGAPAPVAVKLTRESVERTIKVLPELAQKTSAQQAQLMASGGAAPGAQPTPQQIEELQAIFKKHGSTMEEFGLHVSALLATYLILSPEAFEKHLPSEDKPEIKALLTDPSIPPAQKDAIRKQIAHARSNRDAIRGQLLPLATAENQAVVKPMLAEVGRAFDQAELEARKAMAGAQAGPRRKKTP